MKVAIWVDFSVDIGLYYVDNKDLDGGIVFVSSVFLFSVEVNIIFLKGE